jgi:prepilin peptidase CpaA
MFATSPFGLIAGLTFTLLLAYGAAADICARRIPNHLVLLIAVLGAGYAIGSAPGFASALHALAGIGIGLAIWVPFYALRMVGAGDAKFFAAASAWLGPKLALNAALTSAIVGGVLAIGWVLWLKVREPSVVIHAPGAGTGNATDESGRVLAPVPSTLPYGVAMTLGIWITAWFPHLHLLH